MRTPSREAFKSNADQATAIALWWCSKMKRCRGEVGEGERLEGEDGGIGGSPTVGSH